MMRNVSPRFLIPLMTLCATLPESLFERPLPHGALIKQEELAIMRDEYYALHGWDREGRPSARQVEEGMPEVEKISAS
ncbi:MAG: aldehyde ferredoxin oxidoreductase C-terminal domain-containing protein [bacterium]